MNLQERTSSFVAKNGQKIFVRHLRDNDAPLLVSVFNHMTSESRYRRFHQTVDNISPSRIWQEAQNIAQADPHYNHGLIAFVEHPMEGFLPVGAVRIVKLNPDEAEVAISIRDDFQNIGIGTKLMRLVADNAQILGYKRLVADIQNNNQAVLQVFYKLPYSVQRELEGSTSHIVVTLN